MLRASACFVSFIVFGLFLLSLESRSCDIVYLQVPNNLIGAKSLLAECRL